MEHPSLAGPTLTVPPWDQWKSYSRQPMVPSAETCEQSVHHGGHTQHAGTKTTSSPNPTCMQLSASNHSQSLWYQHPFSNGISSSSGHAQSALPPTFQHPAMAPAASPRPGRLENLATLYHLDVPTTEYPMAPALTWPMAPSIPAWLPVDMADLPSYAHALPSQQLWLVGIPSWMLVSNPYRLLQPVQPNYGTIWNCSSKPNSIQKENSYSVTYHYYGCCWTTSLAPTTVGILPYHSPGRLGEPSMAQYLAPCPHGLSLAGHNQMPTYLTSEQCSGTPLRVRCMHLDHMVLTGSLDRRRICSSASNGHLLWSCGGLWYLHYAQLLSPVLLPLPLTIESPHPIHGFCDNAGIIMCINQHHQHLHPWETIQDDYPIFAVILQQLKYLQPFNFVFHHSFDRIQCSCTLQILVLNST